MATEIIKPNYHPHCENCPHAEEQIRKAKKCISDKGLTDATVTINCLDHAVARGEVKINYRLGTTRKHDGGFICYSAPKVVTCPGAIDI